MRKRAAPSSGSYLDVQSQSTHLVGLDLINSFVSSMGWSFLSSLLSGSANSNARQGFKLFVLGSVAEVGRRLSAWLFRRFKIGYSITAHFSEGDPAYEWVINYLTQQDVWRRSREFTVSARSSKLKWGIKLCPNDTAEYVPMYNEPRLFKWRKFWVEIQQQSSGMAPPPPVGSEPRVNRNNTLTLTMYTLNVAALSSLIEEAHLRYIEGRRPHVIVHSIDMAFGDAWNIVKRKNRRSLESIILPNGLLELIVNDIKDFLQDEEWYTKAGIPYRRGYLLHGPPGTGKTSTIYALAGELGLEIYTLSLAAAYVNDDLLQRVVSAVPKHSIMLLEDIDCAFPSREEEEEAQLAVRGGAWMSPNIGGKVTMSGLLNILDGVGSEDGKLFFATTNYVDRLDPALIRPGRIDMKVEYKLATHGQVSALFSRIYLQEMPSDDELKDKIGPLAEVFASRVPENEFTTAELQGYLLIHRKEPGKAVEGVLGWVNDERIERERRRVAAEVEARKAQAKKMERLSLSNGSIPGVKFGRTPDSKLPL